MRGLLALALFSTALLVWPNTGHNVVTGIQGLLYPSPTATATATPTLTPSPTATSTPTITPTPTPTRAPLQLDLRMDPAPVRQGDTLLIKVQANRPVTINGAMDDEKLLFVPAEDGAWALAGLPAWAVLGDHPIAVTAVDEYGESVSSTATIKVVAGDFESERIEIPPDRVDLLEPEAGQHDASILARVFASPGTEQQWRGVFIWPCQANISSSFGMRRVYNDGRKSYHGGLDISAFLGTPVLAANAGRVAWAGPLQVRGNAIIIDHGCGVYTGYYHLSKINLTEGQAVAQGDVIGEVGNTGLSTGAHLHWEMRVGSASVNPIEWTNRSLP